MRGRTHSTLVALGVWFVIALFFFGAWIGFLEILGHPPGDHHQGNAQASHYGNPSGEGIASSHTQQDQTKSGAGDGDSDPKITDDIQAVSAVIIVLLTGVIVCIYRRQTNVMAKQASVMGEQARVMRVQASTMINQTSLLTESLTVSRNALLEAQKATNTALLDMRATEQNAQRELRAYVTVSEGKLLNSRDPVKRRAIIKIRNCGQTPAYDQTMWISTVARPHPLADALADRDPDAPLGKRILGPGQEAIIDCPVGPFTGGVEVLIANSGAAIYVYGEIRYRDAFDKDRVTKYRFFCQGEAMLEGNLAPDVDGNKAD